VLKPDNNATHAEQNSALAMRISKWLSRFDLPSASIPVDISDMLFAATSAERAVRSLLELDIREPGATEKALTLSAHISVQLFTELKGHLDSLESVWGEFEAALDDFDGAGKDHHEPTA
jgi:hypothetical protein